MPNSYVFRTAVSAEGLKTILRRIRAQEAALLDDIDHDLEQLQSQLSTLKEQRKQVVHAAWQRGNVVRLNEVQALLPRATGPEGR